MKAVLDVGQYVSAAINSKGHPAQILKAWQAGAFELYASEPILNDLRRALFYPRIRKHIQRTEPEIHYFVDSLALACRMTPSTMLVRAVEDDPDDDKILVCAVEGEADYVISSDKHILSLGNFRAISIVSPRRFLTILNQKLDESG